MFPVTTEKHPPEGKITLSLHFCLPFSWDPSVHLVALYVHFCCQIVFILLTTLTSHFSLEHICFGLWFLVVDILSYIPFYLSGAEESPCRITTLLFLNESIRFPCFFFQWPIIFTFACAWSFLLVNVVGYVYFLKILLSSVCLRLFIHTYTTTWINPAIWWHWVWTILHLYWLVSYSLRNENLT